MVINAKKTQLLCLHDNRNATVQSYINTEDGCITSSESMKILGFVFGQRPSVEYHVSNIALKYNKSIWSLVHLKRAGIGVDILNNVYQIMLRPILEYCNVIYHSMLSIEQSNRLESLQRKALRVIYGFDIEYNELLEKSGNLRLLQRREAAAKSFANKLVNNPRFSKFFPLNPATGAATRKRKKYLEENSITSRLFNSPLFYFRRILNEQYFEELNEDDEDLLDILYEDY